MRKRCPRSLNLPASFSRSRLSAMQTIVMRPFTPCALGACAWDGCKSCKHRVALIWYDCLIAHAIAGMYRTLVYQCNDPFSAQMVRISKQAFWKCRATLTDESCLKDTVGYFCWRLTVFCDVWLRLWQWNKLSLGSSARCWLHAVHTLGKACNSSHSQSQCQAYFGQGFDTSGFQKGTILQQHSPHFSCLYRPKKHTEGIR